MVVGLTTSKRTPPTTSRMPSRPLRMIATAKARSSRSPLLNQFTESGRGALMEMNDPIGEVASSNSSPRNAVDSAWPGRGARLDESQDDPARPDRGHESALPAHQIFALPAAGPRHLGRLPP